MRTLQLAALFLLSIACASRDAPTQTIGSATMRNDGTIVLQLRAEGEGHLTGDSLHEYFPGDPNYEYVLRHIGPISPGESVFVKPFPDEPK